MKKMVAFHSYVKFIDDLPMKNGWIFHSYGSLPEGYHQPVVYHIPGHVGASDLRRHTVTDAAAAHAG